MANQSLTTYCRRLTVSLTQWSAHPVLKVFGRCLEAMANLESLNIVACNFSKEDIRTEFSKRRHPFVRKLTLPALACPILQACPKACEVELFDGAECSECMKTIIKACPKVEKLEGVTLGDENTCHGTRVLIQSSACFVICDLPFLFLYLQPSQKRSRSCPLCDSSVLPYHLHSPLKKCVSRTAFNDATDSPAVAPIHNILIPLSGSPRSHPVYRHHTL